MCRRACGHILRDHERNDDIRERLEVENVIERCRKARLRWFGHVKRMRARIRWRKHFRDGTAWEKRVRKTEAEMDGLCLPRHESCHDDRR